MYSDEPLGAAMIETVIAARIPAEMIKPAQRIFASMSVHRRHNRD